MYQIRLTKQADKDLQKILRTPLKKQLAALMAVISENPFEPPYESLVGDMKGYYSRRINIQHRLIYSVDEESKTVVIRRMWTHYGDN